MSQSHSGVFVQFLTGGDTLKGAEQQLYIAVDAQGMPVRMTMTKGTAADSSRACSLTEDLPAQFLLPDNVYDTDANSAGAIAQGRQPVIPPRSHRT